MTPVLLLVAFALAACGDTLVDHRADIQQPTGCFPGDVTACGPACENCNASVVPPAGAQVACLPDPGGASRSACGWECTGGLLKCSTGCCTATTVAAGGAHSCAITTTGSLYCWGENDERQVTGAVAPDVLHPRKRFESGVTAVAAGEAHTCAAVGGEVRCWGRGFATETTVAAAAGATALAAGSHHTCAIVGGGVVCWGASDLGQTGGGTPIASGATSLAAGRDHACAVVAGEVLCWGARDAGQLGDGAVGGFSAVPANVLSGASLVAAGGAHTCAARASPVDQGGGIWDALLCWGDAPGASYLLAEPQPSPGIPRRGDGSQSIARDAVGRLGAGRTHTCFQEAGGAIQCFGPLNNFNQLGNNVEGPGRAQTVPDSPGATAFAAGADHACAVFADGGVGCWGLNTSGQLGGGHSGATRPGEVVRVLGR